MTLIFNEKSFANEFPQLLELWDTERNNRDEISINLGKGSHKKTNWKCPVKSCHRWKATVGNMVNGIKKRKKKELNGCPVCSGYTVCEDGCCSLYGFSQLLRDEWDPDNEKDMKEYTVGSKEYTKWKCQVISHHKWTCFTYSRTRNGTGCPYCDGKPCPFCDGSCMPTLYTVASEELKSRWIESMNGSMKNYSPSSAKKTWWCCQIHPHHLLYEPVYVMMRNNIKCPTCCNKQLCWCLCNSAACKASEIVKLEWDPVNPPMEETIAGGEELRWWRCHIKPCHRWQDPLHMRMRDPPKGCPCCTNKRICPTDACNSLFFFASDFLKKEWNLKENGSMKKYFPKSNIKVQWNCSECGYVWCCMILNRTQHQTGCPACKKSKLEKEGKNSLIEMKLEYDEQCYISGPYSLKTMPYDFTFVYQDKNVRMELHGGQHFNSLCTYFHARENAFLNLINRDNLKSYYTYSQGENFLALSDLCLGSVKEVVQKFCKELRQTEQLSMYFITPKYRILLKENKVFSNIPDRKLENERFYRIYQIFRFNAISCLKEYEKIKETDLQECPNCKHIYLARYFYLHKCSTKN